MEFQQKNCRRGALLCLLFLVAGTAWSKPAQEDWNNRLQAVRTHLAAGEHRQALDLVIPLQREMMHRIESGPGAAKALAITALSRALAEAGLNDMEAAAWDWYAAQALDSGIAETDLAPFGAAGAALKALPRLEVEPGEPIDPEKLRDASKPCDPKKDEECVTRPELVQRPSTPAYPGALRASCIEGTVVVSSIIDEEGKIRTPWLKKQPESPVMTLSALESLRSWRFKPATLKNEPVKVYYELNVNFKAQQPCGKKR